VTVCSVLFLDSFVLLVGLEEMEIKWQIVWLGLLLHIIWILFWLFFIENVKVDSVIIDILMEHIVVGLDEGRPVWDSVFRSVGMVVTPVIDILGVIHPLFLTSQEWHWGGVGWARTEVGTIATLTEAPGDAVWRWTLGLNLKILNILWWLVLLLLLGLLLHFSNSLSWSLLFELFELLLQIAILALDLGQLLFVFVAVILALGLLLVVLCVLLVELALLEMLFPSFIMSLSVDGLVVLDFVGDITISINSSLNSSIRKSI